MMTCEKGVTVILGAQWGDEGKGKIVDAVSADADICCRCMGGDNAGHTVVLGDKKFAFHMLPSGILHENCVGIIGNGVVINIPSFLKEVDDLKAKGVDPDGRLFVSDRAHVVFEYHIIEDKLRDTLLGAKGIGTTGRGIGPSYASKAKRTGIRVCDFLNGKYHQTFKACSEELLKLYPGCEINVDEELAKCDSYAVRFKKYVIDTTAYMIKAINQGKKILVEAANGVMLDLDFGTYPYVTSSSSTIGGAIIGLGIPPSSLSCVYGVFKAYASRVGAGPFVTEIHDEMGTYLQTVGHEVGVTTGRVRRCGWLDLLALRYAVDINGLNALCITKVDVLTGVPEIKVAVAYKNKKTNEILETHPSDATILYECEPVYEKLPGWVGNLTNHFSKNELPANFKNFIAYINKKLQPAQIRMISFGPDRDSLVIWDSESGIFKRA